MRKIVRGGADDSYGIEVAALAGVPQEVIKNAKQILARINNNEPRVKQEIPILTDPDDQLDFGGAAAMALAEEMKLLDVTTYTPIEALNKLYELTNRAKEI